MGLRCFLRNGCGDCGVPSIKIDCGLSWIIQQHPATRQLLTHGDGTQMGLVGLEVGLQEPPMSATSAATRMERVFGNGMQWAQLSAS